MHHDDKGQAEVVRDSREEFAQCLDAPRGRADSGDGDARLIAVARVRHIPRTAARCGIDAAAAPLVAFDAPMAPGASAPRRRPCQSRRGPEKSRVGWGPGGPAVVAAAVVALGVTKI